MKLKSVLLAALTGAVLMTAQTAAAAPVIPKSFLETVDYGNEFELGAVRSTLSNQFNMGYIGNSDDPAGWDFDWYSYTNTTDRYQRVESWLYVPAGYDYEFLEGAYRPRGDSERIGQYRRYISYLSPGQTIVRGVTEWDYPYKTSKTKNYVFWVLAEPYDLSSR